jgi:hypothetical protein
MGLGEPLQWWKMANGIMVPAGLERVRRKAVGCGPHFVAVPANFWDIS